MARNYRIQKRREKRNSFSTSMRISHSGRRVRASPSLHGDPAGGNWRIFHGTSVPRVTARIDAKDILRERKRGRIRLEVAQPGVIEAIKEPIISLSPRLKRVNSSIYYSYKPSSASSSFLNTLYREMYVYFAAIDRSILEKDLPPRHREKKREIKYSITINGDRRRTSFQPVEKNASIRTESGNRSVAPCLRNTTTLPPPRRFKHSRGGAPVINETCL